MAHAQATLFGGGAWSEALEKYAAVTHLTVQLYDTDERLISAPVHPTALFELFTPAQHDLGIFAACIRRCLTQPELPSSVVVEDRHGLAVVGTAVTLGGETVGVAVAGYALTVFPDQHVLERLARSGGLSSERVWAVARRALPVRKERLIKDGELLRTLTETLLAESARTRQQEKTSERLTLALDFAEAARSRAEVAQEALRDREERLRATFNQAAVGFGTTDLAGRFLDVNQAVCDLTGYSREELLRLTLFEITHADDRDQNRELIRRLLKGELPSFSFEKRYVRKSGDPLWANETVSVVRAASGEPLYLVGLVENIDGRKHVEAERALLLANEQAARAAAEAAGALVRRVQALSDVALDVSLDDLLRELLTRVRSELHTDTAVILLRQLEEEEGEEEDLRVRAALGLEDEVLTVRVRIGEGFPGRVAAERRPIVLQDVDQERVVSGYIREAGLRSLAGVPLEVDGRLIGVLHVGSLRPRKFQQDEVELLQVVGDRIARAIQRTAARDAARRGRAAAEAANRAKYEFLATLSHELRSPLGAILTWAHLLRSGKLDAAKTEHALDAILRSAKAQKQLVEDLLDVSRIIAGKLGLELQPVDLAQVIGAAADVVRPAAEAKGVELESVLSSFRPVVPGDPGRLEQVIWNLLSNAVRFTPKGGRVEVRLGVADSRAEVRVSDTGKGIRADFLPHVFERFRQADSGTARVHGGLGLGLAIVRNLVELHEGTVEVESPGEGQGTTFRVTLPLLPPEVTRLGPVDATTGGEAVPALNRVRVLVVDDDGDTREWLSAVLTQSSAEVTTASSVREALEVFERARPDVLLSDIAMPGEDGYALIRKVRALDAGHGGRVPALALTAYASAQDRTRALAAGYQVHIAKPIEPAALVAAVVKLASHAPHAPRASR